MNLQGVNVPFRPGSATPISPDGLLFREVATPHGVSGWQVVVPQKRALATPAVADGRVFIGGGFGSREFYAFDASRGQPLWALALSDDGPSAAVVADGRVVFNTESCTIFVVDAETGKHLWSWWLGDPLTSQPAVHRGAVVTAYPHPDGRHRLIALDLDTGRQQWEVPIVTDVITAPVIETDSVYFTTHDGTVHRHLLESGEAVWSRPMKATSAPLVWGDDIYVSQREDVGDGPPDEGISTISSARGAMRSSMRSRSQASYIDAHTQSQTHYTVMTKVSDAGVGFGHGAPPSAKSHFATQNVGQGSVRGMWEFQGSRPLVVERTMIATQGTEVRATDTVTGERRWEQRLSGEAARLGGHLGSPPAYAGGKVVVGTVAGEVLVNDCRTGRLVRRFVVGESVRYQPALAQGRVFVGTTEGSLVCFETGDATLDGWPMWGGGPRHNGQDAIPPVPAAGAA
jgi:Ca-activated chloride channel family protein